MKKVLATIAAVLTMVSIVQIARQEKAGAGEDIKAAGGLFPNDFGSASIDVSSYPKQYQATYHVFLAKCSICHTIARPINSQFLEMSEAEQAQDKKDQPQIFGDPKVLDIGPHVIARCVHRMMDKPGCPVGADGKRIWQFLVYDALQRKTGKNFAAWQKERQKLLDQFKANYPARYAELFGNDTAAKTAAR